MNERTRPAGGTKLSVLCIIAVVLGLTLVLSAPACHRRDARHLTDALSNLRQVKFALDGFASDFDGHYPSELTAQEVDRKHPSLPEDYFRSYYMGSTPAGDANVKRKLKKLPYSNDYFRQLIQVGETQSEVIFWVNQSPVCSKSSPDDEVLKNGKPHRDLILQPGDCHWAYMTGQTNTSNVGRPLVLDSFPPGKDEFNPDLWDQKALVALIDGSVKLMRMRLSDHKVLDGSNIDILSSEADAWEGSGEDPRKLLVQPAPAPRKR